MRDRCYSTRLRRTALEAIFLGQHRYISHENSSQSEKSGKFSTENPFVDAALPTQRPLHCSHIFTHITRSDIDFHRHENEIIKSNCFVIAFLNAYKMHAVHIQLHIRINVKIFHDFSQGNLLPVSYSTLITNTPRCCIPLFVWLLARFRRSDQPILHIKYTTPAVA